MKNLILTVVHGYDYTFVQPFVESLRRTSFEGDLVIFVSEFVSTTTKRCLRNKGAILIDYNAAYPFRQQYEERFKDITQTVSISSYRFVFYEAYLSANHHKYQHVLLTDIRDVIFQDDPFMNVGGNTIDVFLEDPVQTFRNSELNYEWSSAANGQEVTDKMLDNVVSCAGVTIGETGQIIRYLQYLISKMKYRKALTWAFDQGAHNGFVHSYRPEGMRVFDNDAGYVATLGAYQPYRLNEESEIVNSNGKVYLIVHQYDRFGELLANVKARYIGNRLIQKLKRAFFLLMP